MQYKVSHSHPHGHVQFQAQVPEKLDPFACQDPLEALGVVDTQLFVLKCATGLPLAKA